MSATPGPDPVSTSISVRTGDVGGDGPCVGCGKVARYGTLFGPREPDNTPHFFCATCVVAGAPRERYLGSDEARGPPSLMAACTTCGGTRPVKLGMAAGNGTGNFCKPCVDTDRAKLRARPTCSLCGAPADPRYTHRITFTHLPHQPTLGKMCCSVRCYAATQKFAKKSQDGCLEVACGNCSARLGASAPRCSRCKTVQYCDRDCQKMGWQLHKLWCQDVGELPVASSDFTPEEAAARLAAMGLSVGTEK